MAINFIRWVKEKFFGSPQSVDTSELFAAAADFHVRMLALNVCINMIANAVGKCEFKTFRERKEVREQEYYLWNVEPNVNQNSTAFLHKLIYQLYIKNEALVIATKHRDGHEMMVVADSFTPGQKYPAKMNTYTAVTVGDMTYDKTFKESEVLHLKLNERDVVTLMHSLFDSYEKLIHSAQKCYTWNNGRHLKVKVDEMASGVEDFNQKFQDMMDDNVRPWFDRDYSVLPEFEGYDYEDMGAKAQTVAVSDIRGLYEDVFSFTARCLGIPPVLLTGDVAGTADAMTRWMTTCIDPLCDQLQEEINRKRYGFEEWSNGSFLQIDTTTIVHFDLFANAANVEKLIGSGCFSINDVLKAAGLAEIDAPWANQHWLTLNISTIQQAAKAVESAKKGGEDP